MYHRDTADEGFARSNAAYIADVFGRTKAFIKQGIEKLTLLWKGRTGAVFAFGEGLR